MAQLQRRAFGEYMPTEAYIEILFPLIASLIIVMRMSLRRRYGIALNWSDYLMALNVPFLWAFWGIWLAMTIKIELRSNLSQPDRIDLRGYYGKSLFTLNIVSIASLSTLKLSILCFYVGAFATTRRAWWFLISLIVTHIVVYIIRLAYIFCACSPVSRLWTPSKFDSCLNNVFQLNFATEIVLVAAELGLFVYPIPFIWGMTLSIRQKIKIHAVFWLGAVAFGASVIRLVYFHDLTTESQRLTTGATQSTLMVLAFLETSIATVAASLPPMSRPLKLFLRDVYDKAIKKRKDDADTGLQQFERLESMEKSMPKISTITSISET